MTDKESAIAVLNESSEAAEFLEMTLRFQGRDEEAEAIGNRREQLMRKIEAMLAQAMGDWLQASEGLVAAMADANRQVQAEIAEIKKGAKTAEQVVKAAGKLDQVIERATELLA